MLNVLICFCFYDFLASNSHMPFCWMCVNRCANCNEFHIFHLHSSITTACTGADTSTMSSSARLRAKAWRCWKLFSTCLWRSILVDSLTYTPNIPKLLFCLTSKGLHPPKSVGLHLGVSARDHPHPQPPWVTNHGRLPFSCDASSLEGNSVDLWPLC